MINLTLDERRAWVLTQILDNCVDEDELFFTSDGEDGESFDEDFHAEVVEIRDEILKLRGF